MNWFSKVKNWFKGLFKKEKAAEAPVTVTEAPKEDLNKKAREVKALGPSDLLKEAVAKVASVEKTCDHSHSFTKQTWVRVGKKKFELHNELVCTKCKDRRIQPIG